MKLNINLPRLLSSYVGLSFFLILVGSLMTVGTIPLLTKFEITFVTIGGIANFVIVIFFSYLSIKFFKNTFYYKGFSIFGACLGVLLWFALFNQYLNIQNFELIKLAPVLYFMNAGLLLGALLGLGVEKILSETTTTE